MAGGNWNPLDKPIRPGFYMNFIAAALASIQPGARGIVACPVRSNRGPIGEFVEITSESELLETFGYDVEGATAYKTIRMALLGGAKTVLARRLDDGTAAEGSITLKDTAGADGIKLITLEKTDRDFRITTRPNLVDSAKQDIILLEGAKLLFTFTYETGTGGFDKAVAAVNEEPKNKWIKAVKVADGNGTLAAVSSQKFTGGAAGISGITNEEYIAVQELFEARKFNAFVLDGVTDAALLTSFKSWILRMTAEGKGVIGVFGGSKEADQDPEQGNTRSRTLNHELIVNVTTGATLDGVQYSSAEVAAWVAGLIAGQKLSESTTYATTPFTDVHPRLTNNQITAALLAGSFVLVHDGEKVRVEKGINTLTSLREGQNNQFKKIRAIRVMQAFNEDLLKAASDSYIGKIINDDDGKIALLNAYKQYMETMREARVIEKDYLVYLNPKYHDPKKPVAEPHEVFPKWEARITDTMENIYGEFVVKS
ncbi:phage tail sheath subtilisin-like domain-containing protein [Brevibacillus borstelensis]|uniref:phage tail sheath subtilisin-like domain-containing protein n=1 Tax=Brevibacillus borstelensis TaxID=45462 RepID=UPI002E245799|nr:phage tail sheath subtilisin-like domain-containing protein [Brevibacillus borstelensis]